jgi:Tfp pilus assembly pilus retraction ATPase PilT
MAINIDDLLRRAVENRASDLHLKVGNHPYLRVDGILNGLGDVPRITPEEMLSMAFSMMTNRQKQKFKETAELDMAATSAWFCALFLRKFALSKSSNFRASCRRFARSSAA